MNVFHKRKDNSPSHIANRKTNVRRYDKEFKKQVVKTIASCKEIGLSWAEIEEEIKSMYGISGDISTFRKAYQEALTAGNVEATIDTPTSIDLLAKAKNKILVERKLNCKQRNLLNYETQVIAYREQIKAILSDFKWKQYLTPTPAPKVSKKCLKMLNKAIYIIADEHFKGKCDIDHLTLLYNQIQLDILCEGHKNVELWYLGDGIDGLIHTGSLASNDGTILPAIDYVNILIERVNMIPEIKSIKFIAQSNHTQTRPLGTSRNELAREDINYLLIEIMKRGLRKDIELVADDILRFNYEGFNIAMLHGHQPYATNKNKLVEYWSAKYHEVPDIILMGHFHQFKISEYGLNKWLVVCPTAKNFNGDYEQVNGYISYSQITKMTIKDNIPVFQIIGIRKD